MKRTLSMLLSMILVIGTILGVTSCSNNEDSGSDGQLTPAQRLTVAKNALTLQDAEGITTSITLPTTGLHETTVAWESSNLNVINNQGEVTFRPFIDTNVVFTATISLDTIYKTREFNATILADTACFIARGSNDTVGAFTPFSVTGPDGLGAIEVCNEQDVAMISGHAFTRFGQNSNVETGAFGEGFTTAIEIYLNPESFDEDEGFVWFVSLNHADAADLITEHGLAVRMIDGELQVGTNLTGGLIDADLVEPSIIANSDWFTITTRYMSVDGYVEVLWEVLDSEFNVIFDHQQRVLRHPLNVHSYLQDTEVGNIRSGWFHAYADHLPHQRLQESMPVRAVWMLNH